MSERSLSVALPVELPPELVEAVARRAAELVLLELGRDTGSPWLSLDDAADRLGVSRRTLERMIARGRVRSATVGRRRLLHRDSLDGLAAAGEEAAPTAPPRRRGA